MTRTRTALAALLTTGLLALSACGGERRLRQRAPGHPAGRRPVRGRHARRRGGRRRGPRRATTPSRRSRSRCARERRVRRSRCPAATRRPRPTAPAPTTTAASSSTPSSTRTRGSPAPRCCPGNPEVVHHVILFQVPPAQVAAAEAKDAAEDGRGLDLLRRHRPRPVPERRRRPRGSAPGRPAARSRCIKPGFGIRLAEGSRIVMQVHYNLLAGQQPDTSAAQLRLAPAKRRYQALSTMLLPAPVELPCRPKHADGELCDRDAAVADVKERFGAEGNTADLLHLLCGGEPEARRRRSPACAPCPSRSPSTASAGTCTCSAARSRSRSDRARRRRRPSSTSRCGTSTTRAAGRSSRSRSSPSSR